MKYIYTLLVAWLIASGLSAQTDNWVTVGINKMATVDFPATPKRVAAAGQSVVTLNYNNQVFTALAGNTGLGPTPDSVAVNRVYESYIQGTMSSIPGIKLLDEKDVNVRGITGKEYLLHGDVRGVSLWLTARAYLSSGTIYSCLYVTYTEDGQKSADKDRFFESLRLEGTSGATAEAKPANPMFDTAQYVYYFEIFGAIVGGVFVFILLAVFVQYLLKRGKKTPQGPPVG